MAYRTQHQAWQPHARLLIEQRGSLIQELIEDNIYLEPIQVNIFEDISSVIVDRVITKMKAQK